MEKVIKVCTAFFENLTLSSYLGLTACTVFMTVLKLTIWENLSWWVVCFPLYLPVVVIVFAGMIALGTILFQNIIKSSKGTSDKCLGCGNEYSECTCANTMIPQDTPAVTEPVKMSAENVEPKVEPVVKKPKKVKKPAEKPVEKPVEQIPVEVKEEPKKKKTNGKKSTKPSTQSTKRSK